MILSQFQVASALPCSPPVQPRKYYCDSNHSCFTPDQLSTTVSVCSPSLFTKLTPSENSTNKDLYLRFLYAETNQTIQNVSFFMNVTKGDKILMHELFHTYTGYLTIKFQPSGEVGKYAVYGTPDPVLGGIGSVNDAVTVTGLILQEGGLHHFHMEILAMGYANTLTDQSNPPKFDSWWSVDDNGNISKYDNDTIVNSSKLGSQPALNAMSSPLKQLQDDGIFGYEVKCNQGLVAVVKKLDSSPVCVKPDTVQKLVERGWSASAVKTVWFEYDELNGVKPPWDSYSGGMPYSQGYYVQNYFKEKEITIFDAKLTFAFNNEGHLFFLVSQDDADKMINLGFKMVTSPPSNTHFCSSINGC